MGRGRRAMATVLSSVTSLLSERKSQICRTLCAAATGRSDLPLTEHLNTYRTTLVQFMMVRHRHRKVLEEKPTLGALREREAWFRVGDCRALRGLARRPALGCRKWALDYTLTLGKTSHPEQNGLAEVFSAWA